MNPWKEDIKMSKEELQKLFPFLENAKVFNRYWLNKIAKDGSQMIRIKYQLDEFSQVEFMDFSSVMLENEYRRYLQTNINSTS